MSRPTGRTTVVFVNFHSEHLISPRALALIRAGLDVVVVDNSDTYRGPGERVRTGGNVGFGAACNRASDVRTEAEVLVLHNPDLDATPETICTLADRLRTQTAPGLLAPTIELDGRLLLAGWSYPSWQRELGAVVAHITGRAGRQLSGFVAARRAPDGSSDVAKRFGSGALLAVHGPTFRALHGFDESYFLYVEDLDLWDRVRDAGRDVGFASDLVAVHERSTGSPADPITRELLRWAGVERFVERTGGEWRTFRRVHRCGLLSQRSTKSALVEVVSGAWRRGETPTEVQGRIRALLGQVNAGSSDE